MDSLENRPFHFVASSSSIIMSEWFVFLFDFPDAYRRGPFSNDIPDTLLTRAVEPRAYGVHSINARMTFVIKRIIITRATGTRKPVTRDERWCNFYSRVRSNARRFRWADVGHVGAIIINIRVPCTRVKNSNRVFRRRRVGNDEGYSTGRPENVWHGFARFASVPLTAIVV